MFFIKYDPVERKKSDYPLRVDHTHTHTVNYKLQTEASSWVIHGRFFIEVKSAAH